MKLTLLLTSLVALSTALPSAEPAPAPEAAAIAVADPVAVAEPGHSGRRRYSQARIHVHYGRSYRDYNYPVTGDWVRSCTCIISDLLVLCRKCSAMFLKDYVCLVMVRMKADV